MVEAELLALPYIPRSLPSDRRRPGTEAREALERRGDRRVSLPAVAHGRRGIEPILPAIRRSGESWPPRKTARGKSRGVVQSLVSVRKLELPPGARRAAWWGRGERGSGAGAGATPPDGGEGSLMANIFAFVESRGADLRKVGLEAVTAARMLADASGGIEVHASCSSGPYISGKAAQLGQYGADVVTVVEHAATAATALKWRPPRRPDTHQVRGGMSRRDLQLCSTFGGMTCTPRGPARLSNLVAAIFEDRGATISLTPPMNISKVTTTSLTSGARQR